MAFIEIQNLTFRYPERERNALTDISLKIENGDFVVICGKSGCGKSTLLRHLKTVLSPFGDRRGEVIFDGLPLESVSKREQTERIGYVLQSPENQIVTDKVWHELAFGLESLGVKTSVIRRHVAEMTSFFGIQEWYERKVSELSGGQKQLLALASVLAMQPDVLILDEPTAQLDPIAAEDFLSTLKKINDEIGTTIILSEHRLEGALPRADRAFVLAQGQIICTGTASQVARALKANNDPMLTAMPTPTRVFMAVDGGLTNQDVPQTVREGRLYLEHFEHCQQVRRPLVDRHQVCSDQAISKKSANPVLKLKDVWFRYDRDGRDIVKDLALSVYPSEFVCVVGGNGTGKSTMLKVITGENHAYRGSVCTLGQNALKTRGQALTDAGLAALPQDPQTLFTRATVFDNLVDVAAATAKRRGRKPSPEDIEAEVSRVCQMTDTQELVGFHPYDISGGEQQRTGLAMALLTQPKLLLLDEPTKGMDSFFKQKFAAIIQRLCQNGMSVLMVSHDVEFCAQYADRCALFFNGSIVSQGQPRSFFSGNSFYTTAANRMARFIYPQAITAEEIIALLQPAPHPRQEPDPHKEPDPLKTH